MPNSLLVHGMDSAHEEDDGSELLVVEAVNNSLQKFEDTCRTFLSHGDGTVTPDRIVRFAYYAENVYDRYPDIGKPVWHFLLKHINYYVKTSAHLNDLGWKMAWDLTCMKAIVDTLGLLHK